MLDDEANGIHIIVTVILEIILNQLRQESPSFGQTVVWGYVRSLGFKVTWEQV